MGSYHLGAHSMARKVSTSQRFQVYCNSLIERAIEGGQVSNLSAVQDVSFSESTT